jgi:hypothetical protein
MARATSGTRSWQRWVARSAGSGLALPLLSCLVTNHPEYGEPNVPAHLVRGPPMDFDRAAPSPTLCSSSGASEGSSWMAFHLVVSDANVDDDLEARIFVNGSWLSGNNVQIPKTGVAERGPIYLCAGQRSFNTKCTLVEVLVSRRFALNQSNLPAEPGDLSLVRWWIFDESMEAPDAVPADCSEKEMRDGGAS